jgi:hypothetical protein
MERRQLILRLAGLTSMDFWVFSFFAGGLAIDASRHWQLSETAHGLTEYTTLLLGAPLPSVYVLVVALLWTYGMARYFGRIAWPWWSAGGAQSLWYYCSFIRALGPLPAECSPGGISCYSPSCSRRSLSLTRGGLDVGNLVGSEDSEEQTEAARQSHQLTTKLCLEFLHFQRFSTRPRTICGAGAFAWCERSGDDRRATVGPAPTTSAWHGRPSWPLTAAK